MTGAAAAALRAAGAVGVPLGAAAALLGGGRPVVAVQGSPPPTDVPAQVVTVPDVVGMPVGTAQGVAGHSRLRFHAVASDGTHRARLTAGAGGARALAVFSMRPRPGSLVAPGSLVIVRVREVVPARPGG
jgi:hypothetical protein